MVNSSSQHKPQPVRRAAAWTALAMAAVLATVTAVSVLWPALGRDDQARALETACQNAGPGDLVLLYHAGARPALPAGCPVLPLASGAPPGVGLGWFNRLLLVRDQEPPPAPGLEVLERREVGQAHLWLARARDQARLLGDHHSQPWGVALERQGQLWPCTRRPDESWRCDRAGGHKALWRDAARGCLQLGPWDRGAVILQGEPPPGSNALVLGWEGEQAARLTLEPGARALALRPGQHQQAVALPARPRRWSLRLAAGAPPGLCLTWRWRAPYAAPDQEGWEAQVKAGRARLSQGASAQEVLLGYARGGAAQPPGSPPAP